MSEAERFALEYADAVSTHRLENLYGTSQSYTLEKAKERDEAWGLLAAELRRLAVVEQELEAHKAARMAYASEFPPNADGEPDVGSIHQNIRAMKAELEALKRAISEAEPVAWACWSNCEDTKKHKPSLTTYEPTIFEKRVRLYTLKGIKGIK